MRVPDKEVRARSLAGPPELEGARADAGQRDRSRRRPGRTTRTGTGRCRDALEKRSRPDDAVLRVLEVVPGVGEAIGQSGRQRSNAAPRSPGRRRAGPPSRARPSAGARARCGPRGRPPPGSSQLRRRRPGRPRASRRPAWLRPRFRGCSGGHLAGVPPRSRGPLRRRRGSSVGSSSSRRGWSVTRTSEADRDLDRAAAREGVEGGQSHHRQRGRRQGLGDEPT